MLVKGPGLAQYEGTISVIIILVYVFFSCVLYNAVHVYHALILSFYWNPRGDISKCCVLALLTSRVDRYSVATWEARWSYVNRSAADTFSYLLYSNTKLVTIWSHRHVCNILLRTSEYVRLQSKLASSEIVAPEGVCLDSTLYTNAGEVASMLRRRPSLDWKEKRLTFLHALRVFQIYT